jgi:hypothetical protein
MTFELLPQRRRRDLMHDLLSLPQMLVSLDGVPQELLSMYRQDDDGVYVLTDVARANIAKVASGIRALAAQRDVEARRAQAAAKSAAVMSAVLLAGAQGVMAAAACALLESEQTITMTKGVPVVQTPVGEIPLREMVAEWMTSGAGSVFLPQHRAEKPDDYFWRQLVSRTS